MVWPGLPLPSRPDALTTSALSVGTRGQQYEGGLGEGAASGYYPEMESRKVGWGDPALVYDEEKDLFRFRDGRFAFSCQHTDWERLRKRGRMKGL